MSDRAVMQGLVDAGLVDVEVGQDGVERFSPTSAAQHLLQQDDEEETGGRTSCGRSASTDGGAMSELLVNQMAIEVIEAKRLRQVVEFRMQPEEILQTCGQLQLAMRHPGNNGGAATFARSFVDVCVQWFRDRGHVACVVVLERGDDPTFDMNSEFHALRTLERVEVLQECVRRLTTPASSREDLEGAIAPGEMRDRLDTYRALVQDILEARGDVLEAFDRYRHALQQIEALR